MRYPLVLAVLVAVCALPAWALTAGPEAKLLPSDGAAWDIFGASVAVDGGTALIGAMLDDDLGEDSGSAYVFTYANEEWNQQAKLLAADGAAEDWFGDAVALHGDTALVGASLDDDSGEDSGSVYVFVRTGGNWMQQAKLVADDGAPNDVFGKAVALHGDTAVIGAWGDDDIGTSSGAAYVFVRTDGTWSQQAKLLAADGNEGAWFGWSVALDGNTALVGAMSDSDAGSHSGSAYVFVRGGADWTQEAKLVADDADGDDLFGYSVAVDGDNALVGAMNADRDEPGSFVWVGAAYLFNRLGTMWSQQAKLIADDIQEAGDSFGASVSMDGDTLIVGAYGRREYGDLSGAAYVFRMREDADVPAIGGIGIVVVLLAVLAGGAYFLRRRAAT